MEVRADSITGRVRLIVPEMSGVPEDDVLPVTPSAGVRNLSRFARHNEGSVVKPCPSSISEPR